MLIRISTDNLFVTNRLKEIDKNYYVVFNTKKNRYEIHSKRQADNTFCVSLPFLELDERTIDYVYQTRVENIEEIIKKIEKNNKKIESKNKKEILNKIEEVFDGC